MCSECVTCWFETGILARLATQWLRLVAPVKGGEVESCLDVPNRSCCILLSRTPGVWCGLVCRLSLPVHVLPLQIIKVDQVLLQGPDGGVPLTCRPAVRETHLVGAEPPVWTAPRTHLNTPDMTPTRQPPPVSPCMFPIKHPVELTMFIGYLHIKVNIYWILVPCLECCEYQARMKGFCGFKNVDKSMDMRIIFIQI